MMIHLQLLKLLAVFSFFIGSTDGISSKLGENCYSDITCGDGLMCYAARCSCKKDHYLNKTSCIKRTDKCVQQEDCTGPNVHCNYDLKVCECDVGFHYEYRVCLPAGSNRTRGMLGEICALDENCNKNLLCDNSTWKCFCRPGFEYDRQKNKCNFMKIKSESLPEFNSKKKKSFFIAPILILIPALILLLLLLILAPRFSRLLYEKYHNGRDMISINRRTMVSDDSNQSSDAAIGHFPLTTCPSRIDASTNSPAILFSNETAPPSYEDTAPPSYEDAMRRVRQKV